VFCSVPFFSRPRSEGFGRTFSICPCPLSFWSTLPRRVLSTYCYLFCTPPISCRWLLITLCILICTRTTLKFTAGPHHQTLACSKPICRSASTTWWGGHMLQQATVERTEDWVHLVCSCTSSPLHSLRRRTSRSRLSTSGPLRQRPRCVRWRCHDDEDSHQPCTVVML